MFIEEERKVDVGARTGELEKDSGRMF